ncbi:MAG: hypothetical protein II842_19880, partial [Butyrivibrio sp.]|nr:hypothetical protein [Butyrivibrio sp.]
GEEELKQLEEAMEMLETMEVVNPHMSKEDLEELKRKHRASEDKAIMKANMEYLKDMIKHELGKNASMPGMGGSGVSPATSMSMPQGMGIGMGMDISAPQASAPSFDIQI